MDESSLKKIMKYHLRSFADPGQSVTDKTVHSEILDSEDGYGSANSQRIYKAFIRWTLIQNGHEDKEWPKNWMQETVEGVAPKLMK